MNLYIFIRRLNFNFNLFGSYILLLLIIIYFIFNFNLYTTGFKPKSEKILFTYSKEIFVYEMFSRLIIFLSFNPNIIYLIEGIIEELVSQWEEDQNLLKYL